MSSPKNPSVQTLTVTARDRDQRIDNYILRQLRGVPRSLIYRLVRSGQVRVNGGRIKPAYRLQDGDQVRLPPVRMQATVDSKPPAGVLEAVAAATLFEDRQLLVLNKPSGIAVHSGTGVQAGVIEALRALRPELDGLELAHRLDRDTSGCLVLAKDRSCLRALNEALRDRAVNKRYLALLGGAWRGGARTVDQPLARGESVQGGERRVRIDAGGKGALSRFTPRQVFRDATLADVEIGTGRTHQIRVHAQSLGHPLLGDDKYGDRSLNRAARKWGLKRLFLHAWRIEFELDGRHRSFEAPMPAALETVLQKLEPL